MRRTWLPWLYLIAGGVLTAFGVLDLRRGFPLPGAAYLAAGLGAAMVGLAYRRLGRVPGSTVARWRRTGMGLMIAGVALLILSILL